MQPLDQIAQQYAKWLEESSPAKARRYRQRTEVQPGRSNAADGDREDALVEAVTWWILADQYSYSLTTGEGESGGPDFDCWRDKTLALTAEATAFRRKALSRESTLPQEPDGLAGSFGDVSEGLYDRITRKLRQSRRRVGPVIVVVGSTHWCHDLVLNHWAAEMLISGRPSMSYRIGIEPAAPSQVTEFRGSIFFRLQGGLEVDRANESIAGVLLLGINADSCHLVGALNPWAKPPFDPGLLSGIPFCKGILQPGSLLLDWVNGTRSPARFEFIPAPLSDQS